MSLTRFLIITCITGILSGLHLPCQGLTLSENKRLASLLDHHGKEAKNGRDFYLAGLACQQHPTSHISYFVRETSIFFLSNNEHCTLSYLYLGSLPSSESPGYTCTMTPAVGQKIFTPWHLDAIRLADVTNKANPVFIHFIQTIQQCLQEKHSVADILSLLQASVHATPPT